MKLPPVKSYEDRVLIVAKTHMINGVCVSGLTRETNRSIRLLTAHCSHQPADTPYEIGQVWELEYRLIHNIRPPHVEDVQVINARYIAQQPDLCATLLRRVRPWRGDPSQLYDGRLVISNTSACITRSGGIPTCSTGYWLPDRPLMLIHIDNRAYYEVDCERGQQNKQRSGRLRIRYVGFAEPLAEIPAQTLVRVSLARWWRPTDDSAERCYLQLSGWYL